MAVIKFVASVLGDACQGRREFRLNEELAGYGFAEIVGEVGHALVALETRHHAATQTLGHDEALPRQANCRRQ